MNDYQEHFLMGKLKIRRENQRRLLSGWRRMAYSIYKQLPHPERKWMLSTFLDLVNRNMDRYEECEEPEFTDACCSLWDILQYATFTHLTDRQVRVCLQLVEVVCVESIKTIDSMSDDDTEPIDTYQWAVPPSPTAEDDES